MSKKRKIDAVVLDDPDKPMEIVFAPGCFDGFEGTQEELDGLLAEIHKMFEAGDFMDNSELVDLDSLTEEEFNDLSNAVQRSGEPRKLQ